jgi:digeranylgeranylglycerophospholipid reductase
MESYDIIVVGGGPAGLLAARKASEKDTHVLLLEREKALGKKVCAEAISDTSLKDSELDSRDFIVNEIVGARVYAPDESKSVKISGELIGEHGGYVLDKRMYLEALADATRNAGVDLRLGANVVDVQRNKGSVNTIVKENGETKALSSKILIGCDGFGSIVARKFFNTSRMTFISCIQYTLEGCKIEDEDLLEFYLGNDVAPRGYVWVFPKGKGIANVGLGVRGTQAKPYLDKFLKKHRKRFENSKTLSVGAAPVVVSGQLDRIVLDNMMICGEAAGHVIPLTGAGIHTSLVAGRIAGRVAAEAISENDFTEMKLSQYVVEFDKIWGSRIKRSLKALKVVEQLSDSEMNIMADVLKGDDILDLANGIDLERVAKGLLKHPILAMKVAKALMA